MKNTIIVFLALWVIATVILTGCSQAAPSPTPTPSPSPTALTAGEIIGQSSGSLAAATAFHFELDQVGGGTPIALGIEMIKMSGDVVKPDKLKATITGTFMGTTLAVQLITVDDTTYMTNPLSGKWEIPPEQFQILSVFDPNSGIAAIIQGMTSLAKLADETNSGVVCYHVKGSIASEALSAIAGSSAPGTTINAEVWIGKADFLIRNIKLDGKITATEKDGIVRTLSLSNYNQPVDIQSPS